MKIAFILTLSALGEVLADFAVFQQTISGKFTVANARAYAQLQTLTPDLRQRLVELGFGVRSLTVERVSRKHLATISLAERLTDDNTERFNIMV